jgi:hypothetical protein
LNPSPIVKVLSIFRKHRVRALLMGGQACILYGAAEFSRDIDLAILPTDKNLALLRKALMELQAEPVFVPPLQKGALLRGHASHFRVGIPQAKGLRIDVMSVMHGCDRFDALWARRKAVPLPDLGRINLLALPDLVQAKKTQRDKDWPMVRRLIEADYNAYRGKPATAQITFWFREARTPWILQELCKTYPRQAARMARERAAVAFALKNNLRQLARSLRREEDAVRAADREYWKPLRAELARWWREQRRNR